MHVQLITYTHTHTPEDWYVRGISVSGVVSEVHVTDIQWCVVSVSERVSIVSCRQFAVTHAAIATAVRRRPVVSVGGHPSTDWTGHPDLRDLSERLIYEDDWYENGETLLGEPRDVTDEGTQVKGDD